MSKLNMAKMAIYGTLAIRPSANNMGKWGIPEKSYENVVLIVTKKKSDTI